jgi:hypothetical protein
MKQTMKHLRGDLERVRVLASAATNGSDVRDKNYEFDFADVG